MIRLFLLAFIYVGASSLAVAETLPMNPRAHLEAGRYVEAIESARTLIAERPSSAENLQTLAEALSETGNYEQALSAYKNIPDGPAGPRLDVEIAIARIERAHVASSGWRKRAQIVLDAYQARGDTFTATEFKAAGDAAWLLADQNPALYAQALGLYEQAIERDPKNPRFHVAIGDLLLDRYNNEEALEAYRAAINLDANFIPALFGIARSQHFDHSGGVMETLVEVLDIQPNHLGALILSARLHLELENYADAERLIGNAMSVNPRSPDAHSLSAALAFLRGDEDTFRKMNSDLRKYAPGHSRHYEILAEIAAQNRFYARAEEFAMLAVNLNSYAWRGYALLGVNRLRLGEIESGRAALEVAFRGDPFDPRTKNALELLDVLDGYKKIRSARFVLSADPREIRVVAPRVIAIAERAYDYFSEVYGYQPPTPIRIELYRRHEDFSVRITGLVGVDLLGVSFGPVVALDSPSAGVFGPVNLGSTLWHELAHSFHLGFTGSRVPRWFSEALAVFEERRARAGWGFDVTPEFLQAFQQGRLAPAGALNQAFLRPSYPEQTVHAYFQGGLLMEMIERDHGFNAILRMLEGYRDGRTTQDIFQTVLGSGPQELNEAFNNFVRQRFGRALDALVPVVDAEDGSMPRGRYPHLIQEAHAALEAENFEHALSLLSKAQQLFPEHAGPDSTYPMLAGLYLKRGQTNLAIDQLERSVSIDADDLSAHQKLLELYLETGEPARAADIIDRALLIQPFDLNLYHTLANIRESRKEWSLAVAARESIVALDPSDPAEAHYLLARAHHHAGDSAAAKREILSALETAPLYEEALELLLRIRQTPEAQGNLETQNAKKGDQS